MLPNSKKSVQQNTARSFRKGRPEPRGKGGQHQPATPREIKPLCTRCIVALVNDTCLKCGVWYGEECPACGESGYHDSDCPEIEDTCETTKEYVQSGKHARSCEAYAEKIAVLHPEADLSPNSIRASQNELERRIRQFEGLQAELRAQAEARDIFDEIWADWDICINKQ